MIDTTSDLPLHTTNTMSRKLCPSIAAANFEAVTYLQQNDHQKAAQRLRSCLRTMRDHEASKSNSCSSLTLRSKNKHCSSHQEWSIKAVPIPEIEPTDGVTGPDNVFSFFHRAILMTGDDEGLIDAVTRKNTATVLLYNMGLCHHHKGLVAGKPKHLRQALYYYHMAYETIDDIQPIPELTSYLLLALANNMGHLYAHFFEFSEMRVCYEMFLYVSASISLDNNVIFGDDKQFFCFTMNCFLAMHINAAPAA